jgi:hypothetical protein
MDHLKEFRCSIGELFDAIAEYESHTFITNEEFLQKTQIQLQDAENNWKNVPALIKKRAKIVKLTFSDNSFIECADKHLIRIFGDDCKLAKDIQIGEEIQKSDGTFVFCIENLNLNKEEDVFDLQIDTPTHLYQTANGIVHHNTLLAQSIAKYLDVPFAIADATSLTEAG